MTCYPKGHWRGEFQRSIRRRETSFNDILCIFVIHIIRIKEKDLIVYDTVNNCDPMGMINMKWKYYVGGG
jgi:hypothetical protein